MNLCAMEPMRKPRLTRSRAPFTETGALRLFVRGDSMLSNWVDSLVILTSRVASRSSAPTSYVLRGENVARVRFAGRSIGASFVLHLSVLAVLIYLPQAIPAKALPLISTSLRAEKIYYRVPPLDPARMPQLSPAGTGGRPGSGSGW